MALKHAGTDSPAAVLLQTLGLRMPGTSASTMPAQSCCLSAGEHQRKPSRREGVGGGAGAGAPTAFGASGSRPGPATRDWFKNLQHRERNHTALKWAAIRWLRTAKLRRKSLTNFWRR